MQNRQKSRRVASSLLVFTLLSAVGMTGAASSPDRLFVRAKQYPVVSDWSNQVINASVKDGRTKIWVFFTDKGFYDERGMMAAAAEKRVAVTPRAAARRAKVGRDAIGFADLPVRDAYVERVRDLGGALRRTSRWLNAASFEIDVAAIDSLTKLPFVHEIRPMIGFRREPEPVEIGAVPDAVDQQPKTAGVQSPNVLNYGASQSQLLQINVIAAHDAGWYGQGVLVCMMDTGYRKDHVAFAQAYADGRVLAEYDFIFDDTNTQDEPEDLAGQHSHGTLTWSTLGGEYDGTHYGPAFESQFVLAKTEDIRSETQVEEDNWFAGMEWADSIGADVISSSLGYTDWYTYANYDGNYCTTTRAADTAAALGIIVCNSMGNAGPSPATLGAPADADSILSCGSVTSTGAVSGFSSRGPTADGRIKPEVCARGSSTNCATSTTIVSFGTASGTSLSTPLVGGAAAVVLSAHPTWTPMQVREALMWTASDICTPDINIGWGIINVMEAINYNFNHRPPTPNPPVTSNPTPCGGTDYTISWSADPVADGYELYENAILVYDGPNPSVVRNHASGNYSYTVIAKNELGACPASGLGGTSNVQPIPATPSGLATSNPTPCPPDVYEISWNSVAGATAYRVYENGLLVQSNSSTTFNTLHGSGSYQYYVIASNGCGDAAPTAPGAVTTINACPCHGDPNCSGFIDIVDVAAVIEEAFRNGPVGIDPGCLHVSRADVSCDCGVDIVDVTKMINVAFRGFPEAVEFCDPCQSPCP